MNRLFRHTPAAMRLHLRCSLRHLTTTKFTASGAEDEPINPMAHPRSTEELKKNHKFWGSGVRKWGSMHKLEGHVDGVKKMNFVHYNLKKDESYTLTISGRAQGCSIDYILLYDDSANYKIDIHDDPAVKLPAKFLPDVIE